MTNQLGNPFSIDRAEHLGEDLYKYYANHPRFEDLLLKKSLVIEGGRGCGKTMFFLYRTFSNQLLQARGSKIDLNEFIDNLNLIGVHFRADSDFVTAFQFKDVEDWEGLFSLYFNLVIGQRLCEVVLSLNEILSSPIDTNCINKIGYVLGTNDSIRDYNELLDFLNSKELELIRFINATSKFEKPITATNGFIINQIAKSILVHPVLKDKSVHIYVDEYENLLEYQQKLINTLVKHPDPAIIDICLRKSGMKTKSTLSSNENISFPDDYNYFDFETFSDEDYEGLLLDICNKRLEKVIKNEEFKNKFTIKDLLGEYKVEDEIDYLVDSQPEYIKTIRKSIKEEICEIVDSEKDRESFSILYEPDDILTLYLNLVLLRRRNKSTPLVPLEYKKYQNGNSPKYAQWLHTNKNAIVYLIAKENRKRKQYYGFSTFKMLSSGITRYFLELCENALRDALRNGFSYENPRQLSNKEQTSAARYVSRYRLNDIDTYTPYSSRLRRFVVLMGNIFNRLHLDPNISEPERNHFQTDFDNLDEGTKSFLQSAELWSVFQKRAETKDKDNSIDSDEYEYHLNHIYSPYFEISMRKQRKLKIKSEDLKTLIFAENEIAEKTANHLTSRYVNSNTKYGKQLNLSEFWKI